MMQLKRDQMRALEDLANVDRYDPKAVGQLQDEVARYDWFAQTLDELIMESIEPETLDLIEAGRQPEDIEAMYGYGTDE